MINNNYVVCIYKSTGQKYRLNVDYQAHCFKEFGAEK